MRNTLKTTSDSKLYKRARRNKIAGLKGSCTFCGYHSGENAPRLQRNWKKFRKTRWK